MMEFTHSKFGKCVLKDITQKQYEDYSRAMKDYVKDTLTVYRGEMVRNYAKLGLLIEPEWTVDDVDEANPGHVKWLADCMEKHQAEILNIDPLS